MPKTPRRSFDKHVLIGLVRARPALWIIGDKHFKKTEKTATMWKEIGDICKITATEAKIKWKALKDQFRRELQKALYKSNTNGSMWHYFEAMRFIQPYMGIGLSAGHIQNGFSINEEHTQNGFGINKEHTQNGLAIEHATTTDEVNVNAQLETTEVNNTNEMFYPEASCVENVDISINSERDPGTKKRKVADVLFDDIFFQTEQKRIALLEKSILQSENSDLQFFKSLVPYMEAFSPLDKLQVRTKIQETVLRQYKRSHAVPEELILKEEPI